MPISQGPIPLTSPKYTGNKNIGAYIETPKTTTFIHPIVKFLLVNTFKSIIGYFAVNSHTKNKIIQVIDKIVASLISVAFNQSNLEPSCKTINNDKRPIANNIIP